MRSIRRAFWALGGMAAIAAAVAVPGAFTPVAAAHPYRSEVVGRVYVNDNTAGINTIAAFARHEDGTLTSLPGSPFRAGGAGVGAVTASQGAIQIANEGRFVLAVDAGSNQISVLRIGEDGELSPVAGSPFWSGGIEPVSIAAHDDLVYVANLGSASEAPNYTGFRLSDGGRLMPLEHSTVTLPLLSQPGDVLFNANGTRLAGTRVNTSLVDSFVVGGDGRLTAAPGSPYAAPVAGPFGSAFSPVHPSQLYVSLAHGGSGKGAIEAYYDGRNGILTPLGASPYADYQTAPCWVDITRNGRYLFAVNTGTGSISSFAIGAGGTLSLLGSTPIRGGNALKSFDIRVSPDGRTVYVVNAGGASVSAFSNHDGTLTELPSSPISLPAGATPFGIAAD